MAGMVSSRRGRTLDAAMHGVRGDTGALEGIAVVDGAVGRRELAAIDGPPSRPPECGALSCDLHLPYVPVCVMMNDIVWHPVGSARRQGRSFASQRSMTTSFCRLDGPAPSD